jgi:hypothetical protein
MLMGIVDASVIERLAKIMSYMHVSQGGKPGKRLKKKEKLRMLAGLSENGAHGAAKAGARPSGAPVGSCTSSGVHLPDVRGRQGHSTRCSGRADLATHRGSRACFLSAVHITE